MIGLVMKYRMVAAVAVACCYVSSSQAAEAVPEPIKACKSLRRDSERLACYDKAVAHIESGAPTDAAVSPENMFGGTTAMAPPPAAQDETGPEELKQITGKVVAVSRTSSGILELRLDNDQVWRQSDADNSVVVENGDSVTISRASLGTFRLTDKRGRSARFKRVR